MLGPENLSNSKSCCNDLKSISHLFVLHTDSCITANF